MFTLVPVCKLSIPRNGQSLVIQCSVMISGLTWSWNSSVNSRCTARKHPARLSQVKGQLSRWLSAVPSVPHPPGRVAVDTTDTLTDTSTSRCPVAVTHVRCILLEVFKLLTILKNSESAWACGMGILLMRSILVSIS